MPAEKKPGLDALSRSPSDSVDLAEFLAANQMRPPGWLDAVNRVASPTAQSASPVSASAMTSTNAYNNNNNNNNNTNIRDYSNTLLTTQNGGSTMNEHTPATSRYPAEVTAMGSPIPVDTDDSDANIQNIIARLGTREGGRTDETAATAAAGERSAAGPQHRVVPPPAPTPANSAPRGLPPPPPSPRPVTSAQQLPFPVARPTAAVDRAANSTSSRNGVHSGPRSALASAHASSSHLTSSVAGFQNSPFGGSHNVTGNTDQTTTLLRHSEVLPDTQDASPPPTTYSSALMQALSRTEGAAVLTSQWTLSAHPSRTYTTTHHGDGDGRDDFTSEASSSPYPPDIYEEAMRAKVAKQQWMALEKARQEVLEEARRRRDCPFAPQVSPYAARLRRPATLRPENRVQAETIRRKQWLAKKQQQEVERELRECTFRPLTVRAAQLDPAALDPASPAVFHHLYAEAEDRRAFEAEVKPQLVQQAEGRVRPSPLRSAQLAEVVERLCGRGVVRAPSEAMPPSEDEGESMGDAEACARRNAGPYAASSTAANTAAGVAAKDAEQHQPLLSAVSQRIVAAQVAAGERDPDIVRHLYRQAERDALKDQLRLEMDEEKARVARAEQAMALAQDRRRLQQEHARSLLAAKFRALSRHASAAQHTTYRASAPQSIALLARAAFDLLSTEETEELLSAVEHCGQHKLREAEFVAVVFRFFAEQAVSPADTALLTRPPPAATVVGGGAANAKRGSSAPRNGGHSGSSGDGSPLNLPKVKREKPDMELIAQIRESRAQALEEWKREHQRQRAIADGTATADDHSFQPAPRRLIPYECRPDVVVPVKMTKAEALRRAYIAARHQETGAFATEAAATRANTATASLISTPATEQASTARELFSRLATSEGLGSERGRASHAPPPPRARSRSAATGSMQRESSAANSNVTRGPSRSPPPKPDQPTASTTQKATSASRPAAAGGPLDAAGATHSYSATLAASAAATTAAQRRWPPPPPPTSPQQQQQLSPSPTMHSDTVSPLMEGKPAAAAPTPQPSSRASQPVTSSSLVAQIMQSTPEERARLGRELLLRQLREHQRRRTV